MTMTRGGKVKEDLKRSVKCTNSHRDLWDKHVFSRNSFKLTDSVSCNCWNAFVAQKYPWWRNLLICIYQNQILMTASDWKLWMKLMRIFGLNSFLTPTIENWSYLFTFTKNLRLVTKQYLFKGKPRLTKKFNQILL